MVLESYKSYCISLLLLNEMKRCIFICSLSMPCEMLTACWYDILCEIIFLLMWLLFFALERSCAIVQCVWLWLRKYLWVLLLKVYAVRKEKSAWNVDIFYIEIFIWVKYEKYFRMNAKIICMEWMVLYGVGSICYSLRMIKSLGRLSHMSMWTRLILACEILK